MMKKNFKKYNSQMNKNNKNQHKFNSLQNKIYNN